MANSTYHPDDTICAIATAAGGAARGMVRVSGSDAVSVVSRLFATDDGRPLDEVRRPTAIGGRAVVELDSPREAPCDLYLWPGSRSYTREPVAELHTFGSPPLLEALLAAVCRAGARLAEPGEFTLRAFLAGRLDLTQAEGVLGVIDARGEGELQAGLGQLAGGLARPLQQLREDLLQLLAELEAGLDFVHEDIEFVAAAEVCERLESAERLLSGMADQMASRHTAGRALQVALLGEPNAGKSSLFNALVASHGCGERKHRPSHTPALVSVERGTTRDYLTGVIEINGLRCELVDTAGVDARGPGSDDFSNSQPDGIHAAAQAMTAKRGAQSAIRAYCIDALRVESCSLRDATEEIIVLTKADTLPPGIRSGAGLPEHLPVVLTSSRTGEGLDDLCAVIRELLTNEVTSQHGQVVAATADRCRESIRLAAAAITGAHEMAAAAAGDELLAAELRTALSEIGKVVGAVYTEDLLDRIFTSFCIGK